VVVTSVLACYKYLSTHRKSVANVAVQQPNDGSGLLKYVVVVGLFVRSNEIGSFVIMEVNSSPGLRRY